MPYYVYLYYVGKNLVYIGKATENPYTRYRKHIEKEQTWNTGDFSAVDHVGIIYFYTQVEMEICELYQIATKKPIWNTQDVYPHVRPKIKVCNIPKEKKYTIQEFVRKYGYGNSARMQYDDFGAIYYTKEEINRIKKERVRPKHPEGFVNLYFVMSELVYIDSTAGSRGTKQFIKHYQRLIELGADFSKVDRIETYRFRTGAEVKIFEKYITMKERPSWLTCDESIQELTLDGIPQPVIRMDEEIKEELRQMDADMRNLNKTIELHNRRINRK